MIRCDTAIRVSVLYDVRVTPIITSDVTSYMT